MNCGRPNWPASTDTTLSDFLTIRFLWDHALLDHYAPQIGADWLAALANYEEPVAPTTDEIIDSVLQEACERAGQRAIAHTLAHTPNLRGESRERETPVLQAAFCIDVRSEVYRRALEALDRRIQTLGFAGFFGLTASHRRYASDVAEHRLPVLLNAGLDLAHRWRGRAGTAATPRVPHAPGAGSSWPRSPRSPSSRRPARSISAS